MIRAYSEVNLNMRKEILKGENLELAAATLSSIGEGVISTDLSGNIIYVNHVAEEILDIKEKELLGQLFNDSVKFYKADTRIPVHSPILKVMANNESYGLEHDTVIYTKDNKQKFVSATCSPVKKIDETIIGAVIILRDITKLKNIEKENEAVLLSLSSVFENAPVAIINLDSEENIIQVNDSAMHYFKVNRCDVQGKHFGNAFKCVGCIDNDLGCGQGSQCSECEIRKAVGLAIQHDKATSNVELNKTFIVNRMEKEFWFKASINPIVVNGNKNVVITLMDITENKNKEIALIKARDYSENILDQIPSLVWKTNKGIECNYVNKKWREYTGCTLDDCKGYGWANVIHPKDLERYVSARANAMYTMETFQLELRIRRFDGNYRWCLVVASPYFDLDKQYAGYLGSIYDINNQKEIEENLARYHKVIYNARDIVFFMDLDGNIIEFNQKAIDTYGYTAEELHTLNVRSIREDWGYTERQMEQAATSGILFETLHKRKNGTTFPVEVSSQGTTIGSKKVLFSVVRDITDRKKANLKIYENQIKYRSLFMNMQNAYAYYTVLFKNDRPIDLKFIEVNEAYEKLFQLKKKRVLGKKHSDLFSHNVDIIMQLVERNTYKLSRGESIYLEEYYSVNYDKWLSLAIYSPKQNDIVAIITDITAMKKTELNLTAAKEAAEAASKAKSEFLANMSHEIRTPINGMVGMIDLTIMTHLSDDQRENLVTAKVCANSLLNIINDVLDFSKLEAGKLSIEFVNFDIKSLIEEIVKTHTPRVESKGLELNYSFSSAIPDILVGDPNRIRQILNNLISNAIKFTQLGSITLTVKKIAATDTEVELMFSVSDTGIGINQNDMDKLFHSFSQIEASFTKNFGGTGLGLAISKNLVELMGGKIGVESQSRKGSTFYFVLKFLIGSGLFEYKNNIPNITQIVRTVKPLNILLAEDDSINQKVMQKILREKGHYVDTANNGQGAVDLFKEGKYDVILMDIQMPEMNGIEAAQKIKVKEDSKNRTPVIAVTAYALQGDRERFLSMGMDDYITKPIQINELFEVLDRVTLLKERLTNNSIALQSDKKTINYKNNDDYKFQYNHILSSISKYIEKLEKAMEIDDILIIENIAHEIKLLASNIDADEIKDAAFRIELASRRGNLEEAIRGIKKLKTEFILCIRQTTDTKNERIKEEEKKDENSYC